MQVDDHKLRLNRLKKISVELKSKVLNEPKINYELISQIVSSVHADNNYGQSLQNSHQSGSPEISTTRSKRLSNTLAPLQARLSQPSQVFSPTNSLFTVPPSVLNNSSGTPNITVKPIIEQSIRNERSSSGASLPSRDPIQSEIQKLKSLNEEIELSIQKLYEELDVLDKKQKQIEEESWKQSLPYTSEQSTLGLFMTKLNVKQYDFDKVDYEQGQLQLKNDKCLIQLQNKPLRQYDLDCLNQVIYFGDKNMRVDFKKDQTMFIFIQFSNSEERDRWDRNLYVNHQIAIDKTIDKHLFIENKDKDKKNPNLIKASKSKSSLKNNEGLQDLKKSQKSDYSSLKVSQTKPFSKSNISKDSRNSSSLRHQESLNRLNQIDYTLNGNNLEHNEYFNINLIESTKSLNQEKQLNEIIVFSNIGDSNNGSRTNTSKFNTDITYQNQQIYPTQVAQPPPLITSEQLQVQKQMRKWQAIKRQLKNGYYFIKYSKNGLQPHQKKIYISEDQNEFICLSRTDNEDKRIIPIENINKIRYPGVDEGVRKFLKHFQPENFCVIEYIHHGIDKIMELGCQNVTFICRFAQYMREFLRKKGVLLDD